jgi:chitodextrinase
VISTNSAGLGPASALVQATTLATVAVLAAQVTALTVGVATQNTLALSWSAASGATGYVVQYRPSGSTTWTTFATNVTTTNVTVTGLVAGTIYSFQVAAVSTGGTGPYSSVVQGQTSASAVATAPGQVTGLATGAVTTASIALSWAAAASATGYIVQYRTHGGSTWSTFASGVTGTSDVVTGLTAGTEYDFQVAATNSAGTGPYSSIVSTTTTPSAPAVPGAITGVTLGTPGSTALPITWTLPTSGGAITNITVSYCLHGSGNYTTASSTVSATATSYTITGLTASTAYDIEVYATNSAGAGSAGLLNDVSTGSASTTYTVTALSGTKMPYQATYSLSNANGTNDSYMTCAVTVSPNTASAVWFIATQSSSGAPAIGSTLNTSGWTQGATANGIYYDSVPRPGTIGTWYVVAVAVGSGNLVGGTLTGSAFQVVA